MVCLLSALQLAPRQLMRLISLTSICTGLCFKDASIPHEAAHTLSFSALSKYPDRPVIFGGHSAAGISTRSVRVHQKGRSSAGKSV